MDYYMEKVIFDDLFLDDQFEEDREVSEFARSELKFEYSMTYEKQTYYLIVDPPKTIEMIRDYLKREVENQNSSLF